MEMIRNTFKEALKTHEQRIGLWLALADSYCAEICANAPFDWVLIDGEHAPNDLRSILSQLQALAPYPTHPVVRPHVGDVHLIKQFLEIGAQSLLIPMVESAEQARMLVSAVTYPPKGVRGVGARLGRSSRWDAIPDYLASARNEICLLLQIETLAGLKNIDEIAAVDGVDGLFIGPSDLSASMGYLGDPSHPAVQKTIADAIGRIRKAGKAAGILATTEKFAQHCLSLGCSFVAVGADTVILAEGARELIAKYKS